MSARLSRRRVASADLFLLAFGTTDHSGSVTVFRKAEKLRLRSRGCRSITADFKLEIGTVADRAFFIHGFAKNVARTTSAGRRRSHAMRKQYRSPLMASIHETAEGLHAAGVLEKRTMREFDDLCLTPCSR